MALNGDTSQKPPAKAEHAEPEPLNRAAEVEDLVTAFTSLITPFIAAADTSASTIQKGHAPYQSGSAPRTTLVETHPPEKLLPLLDLCITPSGAGRSGLLDTVSRILQYSVNTWDQGFLDKLYGSTNAVGLASELLLGTLNTNAHVYQVSPALTLIEKHVTTFLAQTFGFDEEFAGGIGQPGGSASNSLSIVVARNALFPETKEEGLGGRKFVLFTSEHGHYSVEKAAQIGGLGSKSVRSVEVDRWGRMKPDALDRAISKAKEAGETPFYVNATAGTTVLGSFDPFDALADVCEKHGVWLHVDGSWGGSVVCNDTLKRTRLRGIERADSIAVTPHKMLQVPMTCSFLLVQDLRKLWGSMTLPADYLFHKDPSASSDLPDTSDPAHLYDLADLTPQCGRRGDSLKFYLSLHYYGLEHWSKFVAQAHSTATRFFQALKTRPNIVVVPDLSATDAPKGTNGNTSASANGAHKDKAALDYDPTLEPPLLQLCFYHLPSSAAADTLPSESEMSARTADLANRLVRRGFMVDYAPGPRGTMFRVVVHGETRWETVEGFLKGLDDVSAEVEGVKV